MFVTFSLLSCRSKSSQERGLLLKEKNAPVGAKSFLYEMTPIIWEATMKMTVPSPESVPIRLKIQSET